MRTLVCLLCLLFALPLYATDCYVGVGGGQSSVNISGIDQIENRYLNQPFRDGYANGEYREERKSTTSELQFGCVLSKRYGLKVELGVLEGFRHVVHTKGTVVFQNLQEEFTLDRIVRARGYMASAIAEVKMSQKTILFGRVGGVYATATADFRPLGSSISVHVEKTGVIPVIWVGGRVALDDRWSGLLEYRVVGHKDVRQTTGFLQYSFR